MCGTNEGKGDVILKMLEYYNSLLDAGYQFDKLQFLDWPDGEHTEWFWKREFPKAYKWLFACENPYDMIRNSEVQMTPTTASESVLIIAPVGGSLEKIEVFDYEGQLKLSQEAGAVSEITLFVNSLFPGTFSVKVYTTDGKVETLTLYKI